MVLARKLVFHLFVGVYLIVCPLTILYAFGYLVNPGSEEGLVKTGLIDVATLPPEAAVYLGNSRYTQRTPTVMRGLLPGAYRLKLVLKQHQPWARTVRVEAEQATVLDKILLLPDRPTGEPVLAGRFDHLLPVPGTRFVLLRKGPRLRETVIYDWEADRAWPLLPVGAPLGDARILSQILVRESPFSVFRLGSQDGERFIGVELAGARAHVTDLTDLFFNRPVDIAWDPRVPQHLFTLQPDGSLHRLDTIHMAVYPNVGKRIRGVGLSQGMLYVLTDDHVVQRMGLDGQRAEILFDERETGRSLFGPRGRFQLTVLAKDLIVFLGERGELLINVPPYRLVEDGVRGFEFDRQQRRLLIWRKDRLGVVDWSIPQDVAAVLEQRPPLTWIVERGRDIEQAFWVYQGSHVLFRDQQTLWLLELEAPGEPMARQVLEVRDGTPVLYVEEQGRLYALDRTTGGLMAMALLPKDGRGRVPSSPIRDGDPERALPQE